MIRSMSAGRPPMCTGRIAVVRSVMASSMSAGSMLWVPGSTSTKTGTAPISTAASAVARNV